MNTIYPYLSSGDLTVPRLREELEARVGQKLIARRPGPDGLVLYNYSDRCQFERAWDPFTVTARGLVLTSDDRIAAAPMGKFFNLGELPETRVENLPAESPVVTEKMDGSLIIAFSHEDVWRCVTRGSWDSHQARWAENLLRTRGFDGDPMVTYQFELCAPWNRIVVPYTAEQLYLLAARDNVLFDEASYPELLGMGLAHGFPVAQLVNVGGPLASVDLADESVANREGYVARFANGLRVKMKFATYLRLHRILTGLSVKAIWEELSAGREPNIGEVPDEFMSWYSGQRQGLLDAFRMVDAAVIECWEARPIGDRKAHALAWAQLDPTVRASLFRRLDGKEYADVIWKAIKPVATTTFQVDEG